MMEGVTGERMRERKKRYERLRERGRVREEGGMERERERGGGANL